MMAGQHHPGVLTLGVLDEVYVERARQDAKFGPQDHRPNDWVAILGEEFGEAAKEAVDATFYTGEGDDPERQDALARYRVELIQTAAVCVAMVECLDRQQMTDEGVPR